MKKFNVNTFSKCFTEKFKTCCNKLGGQTTMLAYFKHALASSRYNVYKVDYCEDGDEILCYENLIESNCKHDGRWIVVANPLCRLTLQIVLECAAVASVTFQPVEKVNAIYCTGIFSPPKTDSCNTRRVVYGPRRHFVYSLEPNFSILRYLLVVDTSFCEIYTKAVLHRARETFFRGLRLYSATLDREASVEDKKEKKKERKKNTLLLHEAFLKWNQK
jgi:hypothetical protein